VAGNRSQICWEAVYSFGVTFQNIPRLETVKQWACIELADKTDSESHHEGPRADPSRQVLHAGSHVAPFVVGTTVNSISENWLSPSSPVVTDVTTVEPKTLVGPYCCSLEKFGSK
jgi:hypothetical protein